MKTAKNRTPTVLKQGQYWGVSDKENHNSYISCVKVIEVGRIYIKYCMGWLDSAKKTFQKFDKEKWRFMRKGKFYEKFQLLSHGS